MAITIAFCSHKGGVGKTTSASCIADVLSKKKKRVLLIDTDTQGNLSKRFGCPPQSGNFRTLSDAVNIVLAGEDAELAELVTPVSKYMSILPNDDRYAKELGNLLDAVMDGINAYELIVRAFEDSYDYIIFDTKPSVDDEIKQVMRAVNYVAIPTTATDDALGGAGNTISFVEGMKRANKKLTVLGVFFNAVNSRTQIARDYIPAIRDAWRSLVFETVIPYSQEAMKAEGYHEPVTTSFPKGKIAHAFKALVKEMEARLEK